MISADSPTRLVANLLLKPFDNFYTSLFRSDPVILYLALRALALEGDKAVFRNADSRKLLFDDFIRHYLTDSEALLSSPFVANLRQTLADDQRSLGRLIQPQTSIHRLGRTL
jgi:hypothetical protein